jgi:sulfonate transport system ATP-binding protein
MQLEYYRPRVTGGWNVPEAAAVSVQDVSVHFFVNDTRITALENVSLDFPAGSFVSILGPSGCGKSTLLNLVAGVNAPDAGTVHCNGEPVTGANTAAGYLTQRDTMLPWRSVLENVRLPFELRAHADTKDADSRVAWAIRTVGLAGFEDHAPGELSGGMLKRAALAQTLAYSRDLILMDEPFGALDAQLKLQLHRELLRIWAQERRTIMFVTHDIEEAIALSDTVVVLGARPGHVRAVVPVDLPRPRDPVEIRFTEEFGKVHQHVWDLLEVTG